MKKIKLKSGLKKKIKLPDRKAKSNEVKVIAIPELTDEEMAVPGDKPSIEKLEAWLSKEDGEKFEIDEAFSMMRRELGTFRNKKK